MKNQKNINLIFITLFLFLLSSCASSDEDLFGIATDTDTSDTDVTGLLLSSTCGVRTDLGVSNPQTNARVVQVQVLRSDSAIITNSDGTRQLIKFHGVNSSGVDELRVQNGVNVLNQALAGGAYFVSSGSQCPFTFSDGGLASLGQLFSLADQNVNELMIEMGAVVPSTDICDGAQLAQCYQTIQPTIIEPEVSGDEISTIGGGSSGANPPCSSLAFGDGRGGDLWLAASESNGLPVYLLNSGWQSPASVQAQLTSGSFVQAEFTGFANPDADGRLRPHFRFSQGCTSFTGRLIVSDASQTCEVNLPGDVCSRID